jgi:hypothetical protein
MAHLSKEPTTKDKLATIVQGFDDFDTEMKRGTRVRNAFYSVHITPYLFRSLASTRKRRVPHYRAKARNVPTRY